MHTPTNKHAGWATIALLVLLVGCQKSSEEVTATSQDCQLQSELTIYNSGQHTGTTYTYNSKGQLITSVASTTSDATRSPTTLTSTYSYDAAGNEITSTTQDTSPAYPYNSTTTFEYTDGRLTKQVTKPQTSSYPSYIYSYSYDGSGQIATYSFSRSEPGAALESYSYTNGQLTSGTTSSGGQSSTLIVANGQINGLVSQDGTTNRNTYDARGHLTRSDYFDKAGTLQSYTIYEYSATGYKRASFNPLPPVLPTFSLNLHGNTDLPNSRVAIYKADGSLIAETTYQYQVNSKGYISSLSYVQNQTGVSGQATGVTTYTYSNCQ